MRESKIEKYFVESVEGIGALQRKLAWVNRGSAPDRIVFHGWSTFLVELKAEGSKPRPAQEREFDRIRARGVRVHVLSSLEQVDMFIKYMFSMERIYG